MIYFRLLVCLVFLLAVSCMTPFERDISEGRRAGGLADYHRAEKQFLKAVKESEKPYCSPYCRAIAYYYLGDLYFTYPQLDRYNEALPLFEKSLDQWEILVGEHPATAIVISRIGDLKFESHEIEESRRLHKRARKIYQSFYPESDHRDHRSEMLFLHADEAFLLACTNIPDC